MANSGNGATSSHISVRPWVALGTAEALALGAVVAAALALGDTSDVVLVLVGGLALIALSVALLLPIIAPLPSKVAVRQWPALRGPGMRRGFTGGAGGGAVGDDGRGGSDLP